jgi:hypothetical protein
VFLDFFSRWNWKSYLNHKVKSSQKKPYFLSKLRFFILHRLLYVHLWCTHPLTIFLFQKHTRAHTNIIQPQPWHCQFWPTTGLFWPRKSTVVRIQCTLLNENVTTRFIIYLQFLNFECHQQSPLLKKRTATGCDFSCHTYDLLLTCCSMYTYFDKNLVW